LETSEHSEESETDEELEVIVPDEQRVDLFDIIENELVPVCLR